MTAPTFLTSFFSNQTLKAINHLLDQAGWARKKLQPFSGRGTRITMPPLSFSFSIDSNGYLLAGVTSTDLDIILPADTPLLAMRGSEKIMKAAQIKGPADMADSLGFVLRHLHWDIEEDLSKALGDIAAHRIVAGINAFTHWQGQAARNMAENIGEYLVEERQTLIKPSAMASFSADVEKLCIDLDRVEQRVTRLTK